MKMVSKLGLFILFCISLNACVTTRDQLNQERGIGTETDAASGGPSYGEVKSEDITHEAKAAEPVKEVEPVVVKKPETTSPDAPANHVPMAPPVSATQTQAPVQPNPVAPGVAVPVAAATPVPAKDLSAMNEDELRAEVAKLSGRTEELEHDKQINDQSKADEQKKAEARIAELEKQLKELKPDVPQVPEGKSAFEAGKESFSSEKYDEAIVFFGQALEKKDTGKEAEEATYLRGESYFKKQQYNKAIVDFSHFPEKFQKSSFHPKALLRIAEAFEATGRKDDAKAFYSDLLDKFPKTAEGKLAKKRLKLKK